MASSFNWGLDVCKCHNLSINPFWILPPRKSIADTFELLHSVVPLSQYAQMISAQMSELVIQVCRQRSLISCSLGQRKAEQFNLTQTDKDDQTEMDITVAPQLCSWKFILLHSRWVSTVNFMPQNVCAPRSIIIQLPSHMLNLL